MYQSTAPSTVGQNNSNMKNGNNSNITLKESIYQDTETILRDSGTLSESVSHSADDYNWSLEYCGQTQRLTMKKQEKKIVIHKVSTEFCAHSVAHGELLIEDVNSFEATEDARSNLNLAYLIWFFFGLMGGHLVYARRYVAAALMFAGFWAVVSSLDAARKDTAGIEFLFVFASVVGGSIVVVRWIMDFLRMPRLIGSKMITFGVGGASRELFSIRVTKGEVISEISDTFWHLKRKRVEVV